jgi:hypothetical protein
MSIIQFPEDNDLFSEIHQLRPGGLDRELESKNCYQTIGYI